VRWKGFVVWIRSANNGGAMSAHPQIRSHSFRIASRGQINSDRIPQARSGCSHCQKRPRRFLVQTGSPETMRALFSFRGFRSKVVLQVRCTRKHGIYAESPQELLRCRGILLYVLFFLLYSLIKPGKLDAEFAARVKFFKKLKFGGSATHYETPREERFALSFSP